MNPLDWFPGYKTYIIAGAAILVSVGMWASGDMVLGEMVEKVTIALGGMTIRKGIKAS